MGQTIEKLLQNGARLSAEAHEIVRIPGLLTDADMIGERQTRGGHDYWIGTRQPWDMLGCARCSWRMLLAVQFPPSPAFSTAAGDLVWANDRSTACWWPCEKLDPLAMPAGAGRCGGSQRAADYGWLCCCLLLPAGATLGSVRLPEWTCMRWLSRQAAVPVVQGVTCRRAPSRRCRQTRSWPACHSTASWQPSSPRSRCAALKLKGLLFCSALGPVALQFDEPVLASVSLCLTPSHHILLCLQRAESRRVLVWYLPISSGLWQVSSSVTRTPDDGCSALSPSGRCCDRVAMAPACTHTAHSSGLSVGTSLSCCCSGTVPLSSSRLRATQVRPSHLAAGSPRLLTVPCRQLGVPVALY